MSNDDLIALRKDRYSHFERGLTVTGESRLGDGGTTDYTRFSADGTMRAIGAATCWDDIRIEPSVRGTGANNPAFEKYFDDLAGTSRGVYLYSFDDAVAGSEKEVFFSFQMPHAAKTGSVISPHVHWVGAVNDATADPRWGLEYCWADIGTNYTDTLIVYTGGTHFGAGLAADPDVTAGRHYLSEFADITPSASQSGLSSILIGRLFRDSANGADTYNAAGAKCGPLYIDFHVEIDALGSGQEYVK